MGIIYDASECSREGPSGYICTLPVGHDGQHEAYADVNEPPCEVWPNAHATTPAPTQARFPHVCPGRGCAICGWVWTHPRNDE